MPQCVVCLHANPDGAKYCAQCGSSLHAVDGSSPRHDAGERRYLTVLFCDLVDSSSLAEELGPEDFSEVVQEVHHSSTTIVERVGGQVSQYLGDGVLVLFGYPHAHEDDAARAVDAALEVQAAIPRCAARLRTRLPRFSRDLRSRAAIHTGLVVVGETSPTRPRLVQALGDAVNLASRLQQLAPPDSLLITAATRRLVGDRFELEPRGLQDIRGSRLPVETFLVAGVRPAARRHDLARRGPRTPFVGRNEEIAHLVERWEQVVAGEGQVVVVSGDPGIGKSRLLAAAKQCLSLEERWFELPGAQYYESSELHPFLEFFENQVLHGAEGPGARDRLARELAEGGMDEGAAVRHLASLLSLPEAPGDQAPPLLADEQRRRLLSGLVEWVWRLAVDSPAVIVFEDVQWFDPTSLDLLRVLIANANSRRVLLLLTCRSPLESRLDLPPHHLRLVLRPLTRVEAQTLVESIAEERAPADHVMRDVLSKSDGVPLFLEEVTRMLVDSPDTADSVPDNLRELLSARLDRLPVTTLDTIRLAAVIGRRVSRDILLAVSARSVEAIDSDLGVLLESGVMLQEPDGYSFKHVLLRDAAYDRMLRTTRADLHGRVASAILESFPRLAETQPELVAQHFTEAGAIVPAIREWSRAGARSLGNGAYLEAAHHFQQALVLCERLPESTPDERSMRAQEELRLRKDLGISLIATQGYTSQAVVDNYERALHRSSELNDRRADIAIPVLYGLWGTYLVRGDRDATDELAKQFHRVEQSSDPLARHIAHSVLGAHAFYRGEFARAMNQCGRAMALYRPSQHFVLMRDYGYEGGIYSHSYAACVLCFTGYPDRGLVIVNESLELSESVGDPYAKAMSLGFAACVARERREPSRAESLSGDLLALATKHQFVFWLGIAHCLHGWSRLAQGDLSAGAGEIRLGLGIWEATGARVPGTYLRLNLIDAELAMGEIEAGLADVERGLRQCRETLESYQEPEYHRLKGELLKLSGDTEGAEREIRHALKGAREQKAAWVELRAASSLVRLFGRGAGRTEDVALLFEICSRLTEGADTPDLREARALLATQDS